MSSTPIQMTYQQNAACDIDRDRWLVVGAGAGAGKTAVLSTRMVRLLEAGESISSIVAMTFTRKAAEEMGTRVRRLLDARIEAIAADTASVPNGAVRLDRLIAAREDFHRRRITTIDSFCRSQLLAHALEAGVSPGFDQLDEFQTQEAQRTAVQNLRRRLSDGVRDSIVGGAEHNGHDSVPVRAYRLLHENHSPDVVDSMLSSVIARMDAWLAAFGVLQLQPSQSVEQRAIAEQAWVSGCLVRLRPILDHMIAQLSWGELTGTSDVRAAIARLKSVGAKVAAQISSMGVMGKTFVAIAEALPASAQFTSSTLHALASLKGAGPSKAYSQLLEENGINRALVAEFRKALVSAIEAGTDIDERVERRWFRLMGAVADLLPLLVEEFDDAKGTDLTFAELKRLLLRFVTPGPALGDMPERSEAQALANARLVSRGIRWLMLDEFQDTDPDQWRLFTRLVEASGQGGHRPINLYVVGDEKQSIYRFRGADTAVFSQSREYAREFNAKHAHHSFVDPFTEEPLKPATGVGQSLSDEAATTGLIRLTANYRSAKEPLIVGNYVFNRVFSLLESGESIPKRERLAFDASPQDLEAGNQAAKGFIELLPVAHHQDAADTTEIAVYAEGQSDEATFAEANLAKDLAEAGVCANALLRLKADGKIREWKDAAVLVYTNRQVDHIRDALAALDVPYTVSGGNGLLSRQESHDLWALCAAIATPRDNLALTSVLRSPFFGITDEGLLTMVSAIRTAKSSRTSIDESLFAREVWLPNVEALDAERAAKGWSGHGDAERLSRAITCLKTWRRRARHTRPTDLIRGIINEMGAAAYGAGPGLNQRLANIEVLLNTLRLSEAGGASLHEFAEWLQARLGDSSTMPEGQPSESQGTNEGGVQVMNVHQSKGKEFGVVVLPYLYWSTPNFRDKVRVVGGGGAGAMASVMPRLDEPGDPEKYAVVADRIMDFYESLEARAESRRVFYVAWTRAKHGLVVLVPDAKPAKEPSVPGVDPDTSISSADILCAALGVCRNGGDIEASLKQAVERAKADFLYLLGERGAHQAMGDTSTMLKDAAASFDAIIVRPTVHPSTMKVEPARGRRRLVDMLVTGLVPEGHNLDVASELDPIALKLAAPLPDPMRAASSKPRQAPTHEQRSATINLWAVNPDTATPADSDDHEDESTLDEKDSYIDSIGIADLDSNQLTATEFGTVVHETLRIAITDNQVSFLNTQPIEIDLSWVRSMCRQVAGRLKPGDRISQAQLEALVTHVNNGIRLLNGIPCTGQVLLEHELAISTKTRRLDCALEQEPGVWFIVDFKTSPKSSDRGTDYADQLDSYARLFANYLAMEGTSYSSIKTALLHTGEGEWGASKTYSHESLKAASHNFSSEA